MNEELLREIEIYNLTANDKIVRDYTNALDIIFKYMSSNKNKPKRKYIKSSNKYDYFLELPFNELTFIGNYKIGFKNRGYNVVAKKKGDDYFCLNYCRSLCKETKKDMIKLIEESIQKDNSKENKQ